MNLFRKITVALILLAAVGASTDLPAQSPKPVTIQIDLGKKSVSINPVWAFLGYDEPNYTYMTNGQQLLTELSQMTEVPVNIRMHHMLVTGDGTPALKWGSTNVYTEDDKGNPVYDWLIIDRIFDALVSRGMHPVAQIGFMPQALSSHPDPYYRKDGVAYPPKDYKKFAALVYAWVRHSVDRYGQKEVEKWNWELWNEPDIFYWKGTTEEYFELYDYTADAVKRALPSATIGGPETTSPGGAKAATFLKDFLTHVISGKNYVTGQTGAPLDLITFHAKGNTQIVDGMIRMDLQRQLNDIDKGFQIISSFPRLKHLPVIIGESDPETCAACAGPNYPQYDYRNGATYSSYEAAAFPRIYEMAANRGVNLRGVVTWAFTFEDQPIFKGFRELATQSVDKPVLNTFRMFAMMKGNRAEVKQHEGAYNAQRILDSGVRAEPDINAIATVEKHRASILVWNYHDDNNPAAPGAQVQLKIAGLPATAVNVTEYRIDNGHSNAYEVWKKMGSPESPTIQQKEVLKKAGKLETIGVVKKLKTTGGKGVVDLNLPSHGVSLFRLNW